MAWIYLIIAGITEIIWAIGLKEAHGFTVFFPSISRLFSLLLVSSYLQKPWRKFLLVLRMLSLRGLVR